MVLGVIGSLGLGFLALVFYFFYIKPRYLGVMYNEMGARIYGSSGSLSELSHRGGSCLRRYYTTYLAQIVGKIGASVAISVIARALGLLFAGFAVVAVLFSGLGAGLAGIALLLLSMFAREDGNLWNHRATRPVLVEALSIVTALSDNLRPIIRRKTGIEK